MYCAPVLSAKAPKITHLDEARVDAVAHSIADGLRGGQIVDGLVDAAGRPIAKVSGRENGLSGVVPATYKLIDDRTLEVCKATFSELIDGEDLDFDQGTEELEDAAALTEAGLELADDMGELHESRTDSMVNEQRAQGGTHEMGLASTDLAGEDEASVFFSAFPLVNVAIDALKDRSISTWLVGL